MGRVCSNTLPVGGWSTGFADGKASFTASSSISQDASSIRRITRSASDKEDGLQCCNRIIGN